MEAATLPTKKSVNKGKIKKTLKNVLCRPDPVFWPVVSDTQKLVLETTLSAHKVGIEDFKKPHWKDLKLLPKDQRPKPPKVEKIDGLLFGTRECCNAINNNKCAVVMLESTVNPRAIVQPVIESCIASRVPVICVNSLRSMSTSNFGIPTSCLGIKCDSLLELRTAVLNIAKNFKLPQNVSVDMESAETKEVTKIDESNKEIEPISTPCPYLYRTSKRTRVFNPSDVITKPSAISNFSGQDFIEFSGKTDEPILKTNDRKSYMKMVLKKLSNNPKRIKVK